MKKFELGEVCITCGVADEERSDSDFAVFVGESLSRHSDCDWGDLWGRKRVWHSPCILGHIESVLNLVPFTKKEK